MTAVDLPAPPFPQPRFTAQDAARAHESWGANCGPGALAAATGQTLDDVRPHLEKFDERRYTNPTMMFGALKGMGVQYRRAAAIADHGLERIQWEGPWTAPGVPVRARYRHTHWVAKRIVAGAPWIFDINASVWIPAKIWADILVPWLLKQCEPKADGNWHVTHAVEIPIPEES